MNPKVIKQNLKNQLKVAGVAYARAFHSFGPQDLVAHLRWLGIESGDVLFVHSSFDAFAAFSGKPSDVIVMLQQIVAGGTLLMPTLPFSGTAVEYVRQAPIFDVLRTPSRMGLITELFRRSRGIIRSVHPTHPVAVWGKDAAVIASGHHLATTPCGKGTPFEQLHHRDGKVLFLGTDIDSLTFYHMVEEAIESRLPFSPFTDQHFLLQSRQEDGSIVDTRTRLFEPSVSRRRNLQKLVPELKRSGAWRAGQVGRLTTTLLRAKDVYSAVFALAERGIYCYD